MPEPAIFESPLHLVEQKRPWERQENESAKWFMRFRRYLAMGSRRSVNKVYAQEQQEKAARSKGNGGSTWYNAVKRYQWEARADAWDREQDEQKAALLRQIAVKCAFVSRPFRITQLNSAAVTLMVEIEKGHPPDVFLAMVKQLQALMHDIQAEVDAWNVTIDASCDSAALEALHQKSERQKALQQERDEIMEEELDFKIAQLQKQGLLRDLL